MKGHTHIVRLLALLAALAGCSFAQAPIPTAKAGPFGDYRYQVSASFAHVLTDQEFGAPSTMNGWTASLSRGIFPFLQVTGEVGRYSGSGSSITSFLAGPRVSFRVSRFRPFVRGLFGLSHAGGNLTGNAFSAAAGGGVDMLWKEHFGFRLLQMDHYQVVFGNGSSHGSDYLRIGFGVIYEFGEE